MSKSKYTQYLLMIRSIIWPHFEASKEGSNATEEVVRRKVYLTYKGLATEKLAKELSKIYVPIKIIYTLDKLWSYVSQLKSETDR